MRDAAKNDLRWRRTERNLMSAFGDALAERPLEKVSVTALSRAADINKATFYLHYRDIYDLAEAYARAQARCVAERICASCSFFEEPERSARGLVRGIEESKELVAVLVNNRLMPQFVDELASCVVSHLASGAEGATAAEGTAAEGGGGDGENNGARVPVQRMCEKAEGAIAARGGNDRGRALEQHSRGEMGSAVAAGDEIGKGRAPAQRLRGEADSTAVTGGENVRAHMMVVFVVEGALHLLLLSRYSSASAEQLYETLLDVFKALRAAKH